MEPEKGFIKESLRKIWEGFLENIGVVLSAFLVSGGYLVAINKIKELQIWVRSIPTDYVLTPLVLLLVLIAVLLRINRKQKHELSLLQREPDKDEKQAKFVTHLGVWWKIYPDAEYIEDFPYCACCEPRTKLVQTEWHPDEVFKCPKTNVEYKLYDKIPREKEQVLNGLYESYFRGFGAQSRQRYMTENRKLKELHPELSERELTSRLFSLEPFSGIPASELEEIISKHPNPTSAFHFVERNFLSYKKYFKKKPEESKRNGAA